MDISNEESKSTQTTAEVSRLPNDASSVHEGQWVAGRPSGFSSRYSTCTPAQLRSDAPDEIAKAENKALQWIRVVVFAVLVFATFCTGGFIYIYIKRSEFCDFKSDYTVIGARVVESAIADTSLRLWMARTLSMAVSLSIQAQPETTALNMSFPGDTWQQLTTEVRLIGHSHQVSWSPLIRGDDERRQFEEYARTQQPKDPLAGKCLPCDSLSRRFINPDHRVVLPGLGEYTCSQVELTMRNGLVKLSACPLARQMLQGCTCGDKSDSEDLPAAHEVEIPDSIFMMGDEGAISQPFEQEYYSPIWDFSYLDVVRKVPLMYNQFSDPIRATALDSLVRNHAAVMTESYLRNSTFDRLYDGSEGHLGHILYFPVVVGEKVIGSVGASVLWKYFLTHVLPPNSEFLQLVVENTCGQVFTFALEPQGDSTCDLVLQGEGDLHDRKYDDLGIPSDLDEMRSIIMAASLSEVVNTTDHCVYKYYVYPTQAYEDEFLSDDRYVFAAVTSGIFLFTSFIFLLYDIIVRRRQRKVMASANRTNHIVSELFPRTVRDRLYATQEQNLLWPSKRKMECFLLEEGNDCPNAALMCEPIADLFPYTTVIFIDIVSFTAWCSERDPTMVFTLLETLYCAFDREAKRHKVFKVETIGDSWVGVCGLPNPERYHAVIMAQFAKACIDSMSLITKNLEVSLGPSTSDLKVRIGLHSGPVTGGVLRGEKARFQLFGDSVNMSARMESTGEPMQIQASKETAELLIQDGYEHWLRPRGETISVKGKGKVQTFWVHPSSSESVSSTHSSISSNGMESASTKRKRERLIGWNVEVLAKLLVQIMTHRRLHGSHDYSYEAMDTDLDAVEDASVLDEIVPILELPTFQPHPQPIANHPTVEQLPAIVKEQLGHFVSTIAGLYRDVPFHNFSHASHVIMSARKLLRRIVNPEVDCNGDNIHAEIYQSTYGISGDPILQFSVAFSALIHDVDHTGFTNAELVEMGLPVAKLYKGKSVAEQNSVSIAWSLLMGEQYRDLRACIYGNDSELLHFRKLVVTSVMATDIADKKLKALREARWEAAFSTENARPTPRSKMEADRRATIVLEYIIQASDVAHTMQHWQTYQKWNALLFEERYVAWINGYAANDPSEGWYHGELWFFDNYIIPTAQKLNTCGVFGVSYHELLRYAVENRKEWEQKGSSIVAKMLKSCQNKYGSTVLSGPVLHREEWC